MCDKNPFKYRGYFYDWQTGLYYLQSRYYDPSTGRFISVDSFGYADPGVTDGLNLYAYCKNNPVMFVDPSGSLFFTCLIVGMVVGATIGATVSGVTAYRNGVRGWGLFAAILTGAIVGGAVGAAAGAMVGLGAELISAGLSMIGGGMSGGFALAGGGIMSGRTLAGAGAIGIGLIGALTGILGGLLGLNVLFASNERPKNNGIQNKQFKDAAREAGYDINDPFVLDELKAAHRYIRKNKLNFGYKNLVEFLKYFLG